MAGPGARGGWSWGTFPETRDLLSDPGYQLTPREALTVGVGKAHRGVNYAHYEFRNYKRSYLGTTGIVTEEE